MDTPYSLEISPIGYVRSPLKERKGAPRQGWEGAPDATLAILPAFARALDGLEPEQDIWIFTWFHQADRSVLEVHPRGDAHRRLAGVFATRSPDRPNPVGLHRCKILSIAADGSLRVQGLEAIEGTPIVDIKPALECRPEA